MASSGKFDEMKGRVKKGVGEVTNDESLKNKGTADKVAGHAKQGLDHLKEGIDQAKKKVEHFIDRNKK